MLSACSKVMLGLGEPGWPVELQWLNHRVSTHSVSLHRAYPDCTGNRPVATSLSAQSEDFLAVKDLPGASYMLALSTGAILGGALTTCLSVVPRW